MSIITKEVAEEHLKIWLEAEKAIATGQSYQIGGRQLTRASLYNVKEQIKYWEDKLRAIERSASRKSRRRVAGIIPRDY